MPVVPRAGDEEEIRLLRKREEDRKKRGGIKGNIQSKLNEVVCSENVEDLGSKYLQPVFIRNQSICSESLTALSAHLILREGLSGSLEVSVCAICKRDESEDSACLSTLLPQQLHLYCGTAVISDYQSGYGTYQSAGGEGDLSFHHESVDIKDREKEKEQEKEKEKEKERRMSTLMMTPVLNLGSTLSSCCFLDTRCAIVVACGVVLIDLRAALHRASEMEMKRLAAEEVMTDKNENGKGRGEKYRFMSSHLKVTLFDAVIAFILHVFCSSPNPPLTHLIVSFPPSIYLGGSVQQSNNVPGNHVGHDMY